jgi:hypothetical protein
MMMLCIGVNFHLSVTQRQNKVQKGKPVNKVNVGPSMVQFKLSKAKIYCLLDCLSKLLVEYCIQYWVDARVRESQPLCQSNGKMWGRVTGLTECQADIECPEWEVAQDKDSHQKAHHHG